MSTPQKPGPKKGSKRTVTDSALRVVAVETIQVDSSYQREPIRDHVNKIVKHYNAKAMGVPVVGEREDGTLWVVDGLQRITALREKGNKWVRAEVFASAGPEEEAEIFRVINKNRKKPTGLQLFHSSLVAGDEAAWAVKEIIEKHGFEVPRYTGRGNLAAETAAKRVTAISAVERIYKTRGKSGGAAPVDFVFDVLKQVWPGDPLRQRDEILVGLYVFWRQHEGAVDTDRLVPRLNTSNPVKIIQAAQLGIGQRGYNVAEVIEKLYRKHHIGNTAARAPLVVKQQPTIPAPSKPTA